MDLNWLYLGLALIVGLGIGVSVMVLLRPSKRMYEEKISALQDELNTYKNNVSDHFVQTAALVNNLTHSYKAVYDHLEKGAYQLVGEETLQKRLINVQEEPVMLEYIGQRKQLSKKPVSSEQQALPGNDFAPAPADAEHAHVAASENVTPVTPDSTPDTQPDFSSTSETKQKETVSKEDAFAGR